MRIALTTTDVHRSGGIERVVVHCANHLSAKGHDVTVHAARIEPGVLDPAVTACAVDVPLNLDVRTGIGFRRAAARSVAAERPDAHGSFSVLSPTGGVFWVPSVHRIGYDLLRSRRGRLGRLALASHPYHRVRLELERTMLRPAGRTRLLTQTERVKQDVVAGFGREPAEIEVLPLGFDPRDFGAAHRRARRGDARRALGIPPDQQVVLFVANELERKGLDTVLAALERFPDVLLLGAGRMSPSGGAFEQRGRMARWLGQATDVPLLHAAADAFVLPTRYEPWGLVIVEALASGLPTVTSALAGAAVAVEHGRTGWLLEDPESVDELVAGIRWSLGSSPASANAIGASVERFAWPGILDRYEAVLIDQAGRS